MFALFGAILATTGRWVAAGVLWILGGLILVAGIVIVSRNVPRAYRDEAYGRRQLKIDVLASLSLVVILVLLAIFLLISAVLIALSG